MFISERMTNRFPEYALTNCTKLQRDDSPWTPSSSLEAGRVIQQKSPSHLKIPLSQDDQELLKLKAADRSNQKISLYRDKASPVRFDKRSLPSPPPSLESFNPHGVGQKLSDYQWKLIIQSKAKMLGNTWPNDILS